jgi:hypothetical protein
MGHVRKNQKINLAKTASQPHKSSLQASSLLWVLENHHLVRGRKNIEAEVGNRAEESEVNARILNTGELR